MNWLSSDWYASRLTDGSLHEINAQCPTQVHDRNFIESFKRYNNNNSNNERTIIVSEMREALHGHFTNSEKS